MSVRAVLPLFIALMLAAAGCNDNKKSAATDTAGATTDTTVTTPDINDLLEDGELVVTDADGDGYPLGVDCDDSNAAVNPGTSETYYNGVDDDCSSVTADDDQDGDGYSATGTMASGMDCNDLNFSINPGATEFDDGVDNDCDGDTIELALFDKDNDGFTASYGSSSLAMPDCDDSTNKAYPGNAEVSADGIDNDCDAATADDDADSDGETADLDCNDYDATVNHSASEIYYDGKDNDCSESTVDGDQDGDGFLASSVGGNDCNDTNSAISPGQVDVPGDGVDNDCQGGDMAVSSANGVYVSKSGNDLTGDGSMGNPYLTIQKGADEAYASGKGYVYVSQGLYAEGITTLVSIVGGFDASFSTLNPGAFPTVISGAIPDPSPSYVAGTVVATVIVEDNADVDLYGLQISSAYVVANTSVIAIDVQPGASVSVAGSTINVDVAGAYSCCGAPSMRFIAVASTDGRQISLNGVDIDVKAEISGGGFQYPYAFVGQGVQRFVVRGGTVTLHGGSGDDRHYVTFVDGGYMNVAGVSVALDGSGAALERLHVADAEPGTLLFLNNTIDIPDGNSLAELSALAYQNDGLVVFSGNDVNITGGNGSSANYMFYAGYGRGQYTGNDIDCNGGMIDVGDFAYVDYGAMYIADNTIDCFGFDVGSDLFYSADGLLNSVNNTINLQYYAGGWKETYYASSGHIVVQGDAFSADVVSGATYIFDNSSGRLEVVDTRIELGRVESSIDNYYGSGGVFIDNLYFSVITQEGGATYLNDLSSGGASVWNSSFYIGTVTGSADLYYLSNSSGFADFANNTLQIDRWYSSGSASLYDTGSGGTQSVNETIVIGRVGSGAGGIYVHYNDDYGQFVFDGLYVDIAAGFSNNYGINCYDCGGIIRNSELHFGGVAGALYGITNDDEYGALWVENTRLFTEDYADTVYLLYQYDSDFAFVNSIAVNTAAVTSYAYGIYGHCCGSVEVINSYINAGGGAGGDAGASYYLVYSSSSIAHTFINSIFAIDVTNGTREGFYMNNNDINVVMRNNLFVDAANYDTFLTSNGDGALSYATYSQCTALECSEFVGNQSVADPMFVDAANEDFHLATGSPAIDAGGSTFPYFQTVPLDFEGDPRVNTPDIGPDETQ